MCNRVKRVTRRQLKGYFGPTVVIENDDPYQLPETDSEEESVSGYDRPAMPILVSYSPQQLTLMNWGLIPNRTDSMPNSRALDLPLLNAKAETIFELPSFRDSIRKRRCIIPVAAFYEHQHRLEGRKKSTQQYYIRKNEGLMFIAGAWDEYRGKKTFVKITTASNPLMSEIHNSKLRQPHIIDPANWERWFSPLSDTEIKELLDVYPDENLEATEVINKKSAKPQTPQAPPTLF